jgi:N-acetylglucosaminyl-diphospho-decaprenol L-rhamnosyltransferase
MLTANQAAERPRHNHLPSPQSEGLDLSVVIVSWNTRELLARCLSSVLAAGSSANEATQRGSADRLSLEVMVVDNASADGSAQMVRERFPKVGLLANTENLGFARANNQMVPSCAGRYVLLLNPDTVVDPGALQALVAFMDEHPTAGAAGARLLNEDGSLYPSCQPAPSLPREFWRLFHLDAVWPLARYRMEQWDATTPREVDVVQGACLILRRAMLDQVGLLDEDYFIYSEEVDLCHRLRKRGWQLWWVPQAVVTHYGGQSTRQVARTMFLRLYQGKVLYFRKNHGRGAAQLYKLILLAAALVRLGLSPLAVLGRSGERAQRLALTGHYGQLLSALPGL